MDLVLMNRKDTDSPDLTEAARCAYIYTWTHFLWIFLDILDLPWDNQLAIASTIHYQGKDQIHQDCTIVWMFFHLSRGWLKFVIDDTATHLRPH